MAREHGRQMVTPVFTDRRHCLWTRPVDTGSAYRDISRTLHSSIIQILQSVRGRSNAVAYTRIQRRTSAFTSALRNRLQQKNIKKITYN